MKKRKLAPILAVSIGLLGLTYLLLLNHELSKGLAKAESGIFKLWDDKIADYQFNVNVTYRYSETKKPFFDSLDMCYNQLRLLTNQNDLSNSDKQYLKSFVEQQMSSTTGISKAEILKRMGIASIDEAFNGSSLETIERFDRMLNPNFMSSHIFLPDFDIWEKKDGIDLKPGDTTIFMIRLLKNYDLNSHQTEFVLSDKLKVVEPYLGELTVIIPVTAKKGSYHKTEFNLYNWIDRDTVTQGISFEIK